MNIVITPAHYAGLLFVRSTNYATRLSVKQMHARTASRILIDHSFETCLKPMQLKMARPASSHPF
jgi:hypothetical protein